MRLTLEVKKRHQHFWLRAIHSVRIDKCCTGCFIGTKDNRVYYATAYKPRAFVDIEVEEDPRALAYYLCGISAGCVWRENTHVAFVPAPGETIHIENEKIDLTITDARRIDFEGEGYKPNPPGIYTRQQRTCRNWIFANYILDGKLRR